MRARFHKIQWVRYAFLLLVPLFADAQKDERCIHFDQGWESYTLPDPQLSKRVETVRKGTSFKGQFNAQHMAGHVPVDAQVQWEVKEALTGYRTEYPRIRHLSWRKITLPAPVRYEKMLNPGVNQFTGICYYRKTFVVAPDLRSKRLSLLFDGAMQTASVWINGHFVQQHRGGYLPFIVPLETYLNRNGLNTIVVRLDNRDDSNTPPGKPLATLGFLYWSGIYRNVYLMATDSVYITNAVDAGVKAGGGVFVRYENVSDSGADVLLAAQVRNSGSNIAGPLYVQQVIWDVNDHQVAAGGRDSFDLKGYADTALQTTIRVSRPHLWSPDSPYLYRLVTKVWQGHKVIDCIAQRIGIRTLSFTRQQGFWLNGRPVRLVGTNRHQDYPFIGNALSAAAQYRDLKKIKEAGMNFIRLSHYPNDPSVYAICDSLGLMLADAIPGWQFFNRNPLFTQRVFKDIREMVRRDRNHPSVILWETSLNESYPPDSFRMQSAAVAHEEYPGDQFFTSGDTYAARQTSWDVPYSNWVDPFGRPQDVQPNAPGFAREYGDYEFGGQESTTRTNRSKGPASLLKNAWNLQWEHNLLSGPAYYPWTIGDANWAYADGFEAFTKGTSDWGIVEVDRIPKFSYYFFKSQQDIALHSPMIYLANWWDGEDTSGKVVVYSNCNEVALYVNDTLVGKQQPDQGPDTDYGDWEKGGHPFDGGNCRHLTHPPFTFMHVPYRSGKLRAVGWVGEKPVVETNTQTPLRATRLSVWADTEGMPLQADGTDAIFVHAAIVDDHGVIIRTDNTTKVHFELTGNGHVVSPASSTASGGIASLLVRSTTTPGALTISASTVTLPPAMLRIQSSYR